MTPKTSTPIVETRELEQHTILFPPRRVETNPKGLCFLERSQSSCTSAKMPGHLEQNIACVGSFPSPFLPKRKPTHMHHTPMTGIILCLRIPYMSRSRPPAAPNVFPPQAKLKPTPPKPTQQAMFRRLPTVASRPLLQGLARRSTDNVRRRALSTRPTTEPVRSKGWGGRRACRSHHHTPHSVPSPSTHPPPPPPKTSPR